MALNEISDARPTPAPDPATAGPESSPSIPHPMVSPSPVRASMVPVAPETFGAAPGTAARPRPLLPSVLASDEDLPRAVWRAWAALGTVAAVSLFYLLLSAKGVRPMVASSGAVGLMTAFTLPVIVAFSLVGEGVKRGMPIARVAAYVLCGGYALWNLLSFATSFGSSLYLYYQSWYQPWSVLCSLALLVLPLYAIAQLASAEATAWFVHRESERADLRRLANR